MKTTRTKHPVTAAGLKPPAKVKANTIAHIKSAKEAAADELVAVRQSLTKNAPGGRSAAPKLKARRDSRASGIATANDLEAQKKKVADETVKNLYLKDIEEWNKHAADLKTNFGAQIGTFAAMRDQVEQVRKDHSALKDAIRKGTVPADTRIMPEVAWKDKEGKERHGFLDFQDYCRVALGRSKQAVYSMLGDKPTQRAKEVDDSVEGVTRRGGVVLNNLFMQALAKDKTLKFDQFVERLKKVATEYAKEETAKASKVETKKAAKLSALRAIADSAA